VAFVLLQLGEIVFPAFGFGPDALRLLLAVLLAGLPIVLALSWAFDVTRFGVHRTPPADDGNVQAIPAPRPAIVGLVLVVAVALGWGAWWAVREVETVAGPAGASSIAVLPFADLSAAGDQTYLGDGLAEEILNVLAGEAGLQVAARTSSFAYRDRAQDVRVIGTELNVATVLEGSVRRTDNHVRVTAQLIDARSGFHLWSDNFDREVEDLFAVQDEIAGAIVTQLLGRLHVPGRRAGGAPPAEAQDAFWRARAQLGRRDPAGIPAAIELLQRAISIHPEYAAAYAGLADAYALMPLYVGGGSAGDALLRAEDWAQQAIRADSALADPWASLGLVRAMRKDRVGALDAFAKALERNASYAPALHWRANVLADMGQLVPALRDAGQAARLDPLSAPVATDHAAILLWSGDTDGARAEVDRALSQNFGYRPALFLKVIVALDRGEDVALRMSLAQWAAVSGVPSGIAGPVADAMLEFRDGGATGPAPGELLGLGNEDPRVNSGTRAALFGLVGARDAMLAALEEAVADGSWAEQYLGVNPVFDPFRDEPEFREILARIG
jgi:TolB-like protein/Tfp pilus assembly protein PilF